MPRRTPNSPYAGKPWPCKDCGEPFIYKRGPQRRCLSCKRLYKNALAKAYNLANPEKQKIRTARAKDRHLYGGNRTKALERDNNRCQLCGSDDRPHVHHKDGSSNRGPAKGRNNDLDNLVTLCHSCHSKVHMIARKEAARMAIVSAFETLRMAKSG